MKFWMQLGLVLLSFSAWPATWYVRPGVYDGQDVNGNPIVRAGVYGAQNGTSYANAWNGVRAVVWGTGGVQEGDTLYICGPHIYSFTNDTNVRVQAGIGACRNLTVRMDYPGDPGFIFAGAIDRRPQTVWHGPDKNGVYWSPQKPLQQGTPYEINTPVLFQVDGTNITALAHQKTTTWTEGLGSQAFIGNTNFVKTLTGAAPNNNLAIGIYGPRFWATAVTYSNLTFKGCNFIGGFPVLYGQHQKSFTFDGCTFRDGASVALYYGNDYWTFANCEMSHAPYGIYGWINSRPSGPNYLTVTNCYIHDMDTANYPDADGHAVGIQGGSHCLISRNRIERTGSAIEFWTYSQPMSNNIIEYNSIHDVHVSTVTGGHGIAISGDNVASVRGLRTGFRIYGNVIWDVAGYGIGSNNKDYMEVFNNTIFNAERGIGIGVVGGNAYGMIQNNLIAGTRGPYVLAIGGDAPSTANLAVNHNLYAKNAASTNVYVSTTLPHDQNSVFAEPLFVSESLSSASDLRISRASKAIGAGISVGLRKDFSGTPIPTNRPPDIGAFQSVSSSSNLLTAPSGLRVLTQ